MKFTEFLKTVLTKKELKRFYKEVKDYSPEIYISLHNYDYNEIMFAACFIFKDTKKGGEYWQKLNEIVENKKEKLIQ